MIFAHTWQKVLSGEKTQTRRISMPSHSLIRIESAYGGYRPLHLSCNGHILYAIGKTYAVQPGRGKPAVWWRKSASGIEYAHSSYSIDDDLWAMHGNAPVEDDECLSDYEHCEGNPSRLKEHGYTEARIRITDIRREDVRCIRADDVSAEGFQSCNDFWETWCKMHDPKATGDNPAYMEWVRANGYDFNVQRWLMSRPAERYLAWALTFELVKGGAP